MNDAADDHVLTITPSPGRRWVGVVALVLLGALFVYIAATAASAILVRLCYFIAGIAIFRAALAMHRATSDSLVLTRSELRTGRGRVLTPVANVAKVDRGAFAFKPSNGFLVHLKQPSGRGWAPGLFWQRGKLLGIGGVIPGGQARAMADLLSGLLNKGENSLDF